MLPVPNVLGAGEERPRRRSSLGLHARLLAWKQSAQLSLLNFIPLVNLSDLWSLLCEIHVSETLRFCALTFGPRSSGVAI